eukprot:CAMPEP_0194544328 /NCGR_PEP_ID=MMETSP0253-20130528/87375_1 /TAXON_ID=2966 /ORGANISM="Noctiluca scintillans" /LENGTH=156 /DNA_ID=CAMNT_0039391207 /DNA_START=35 /DNA_END=502 /DNA_ORIENTATION=-
MPSLDGPEPLVKFCMHGFVHWLLLDDTDIQILSITLLCHKIPHLTECAPSLKRLCDEKTFQQELVLLGGGSAEADLEASNDREVEHQRLALATHQVELFPVLVRILFSRATKTRKISSSPGARRRLVFDYISTHLTGGMTEIMLLLLEPVLVVVGF